MYPFQNILYATDFSPNAKSVLKYAAAFARFHKATLHIHNAQEGSVPPQALKLSDRALAEHGYDWVMAIKKEMEEISNSELLKGLKVNMVLSEGRPSEEIPRVIRDYKIDLATMATSMHFGASLGPTVTGVIGHADCPVLIGRQAMHDFVFYKESDTHIALNRILFATDFTGFDNSAKEIALNIAKTHKAKLTILHSVGVFLGYLRAVSFGNTQEVETNVNADAQKRLDQLIDEAKSHGIAADCLLSEGRSYNEILRVAVEKDIDLIVIGAGGFKTSPPSSPGRNTERVVRGAHCAVMTVKHQL